MATEPNTREQGPVTFLDKLFGIIGVRAALSHNKALAGTHNAITSSDNVVGEANQLIEALKQLEHTLTKGDA